MDGTTLRYIQKRFPPLGYIRCDRLVRSVKETKAYRKISNDTLQVIAKAPPIDLHLIWITTLKEKKKGPAIGNTGL